MPEEAERWIAGEVAEILRGVLAAGYHPGMFTGARLVDEEDDPDAPHSLLELEGLGAELWQGRDAQEYVNELREEWGHRP